MITGYFKSTTHCYLVYLEYKAFCVANGWDFISYKRWLKRSKIK